MRQHVRIPLWGLEIPSSGFGGARHCPKDNRIEACSSGRLGSCLLLKAGELSTLDLDPLQRDIKVGRRVSGAGVAVREP